MKKLDEFIINLKENEKAKRTIVRYKTDILQFLEWAKIKSERDFLKLDKNIILDYKSYLKDNFKINSRNIKIIAINKFFDFCNKSDLKIKTEKMQKKTSLENVLSESEYQRLLKTAEKLGKNKISMIMQTLALTGIRVGELQFITVESLKDGMTQVENKGKVRNIIIPKKLIKELKAYCKNENITTGTIFTGRNGTGIDVAYVHKQIKAIGGQARIKLDKCHCHSFRHLFAKTFLTSCNDVMLLSDLLGHSSLNTTRIYTQRSISEQKELLNKLDLFS